MSWKASDEMYLETIYVLQKKNSSQGMKARFEKCNQCAKRYIVKALNAEKISTKSIGQIENFLI